MALLPLYRRIGTISNRYAKFPEDYEIAGHSQIDDDAAELEEIQKRRWLLAEAKGVSVKYGRSFERIDGKYKSVLLHRLVWTLRRGLIPRNMVIDHINHDGLDNRIANLRVVTQADNSKHCRLQSNSKSGYIGVDSAKHRSHLYNCHSAYICPNAKKKSLGCYPTPQEAAVARDIAASILYAEFFVSNDIPKTEVSVERREEIRMVVEKHLRRHSLIASS
jgi:hypothetical protein